MTYHRLTTSRKPALRRPHDILPAGHTLGYCAAREVAHLNGMPSQSLGCGPMPNSGTAYRFWPTLPYRSAGRISSMVTQISAWVLPAGWEDRQRLLTRSVRKSNRSVSFPLLVELPDGLSVLRVMLRLLRHFVPSSNRQASRAVSSWKTLTYPELKVDYERVITPRKVLVWAKSKPEPFLNTPT